MRAEGLFSPNSILSSSKAWQNDVMLIARRAAAVLSFFSCTAFLPVAASSIELRDAELVSGGSAVLQDQSGTVRLEDARLGRIGPTTYLPEPGALGALVSGAGMLGLLWRVRRARGPRGLANEEIR
jgi:hypothetical protein